MQMVHQRVQYTKFERIDLKKSNIYKETTRREDAVRTLINELKSNDIISEHLGT